MVDHRQLTNCMQLVLELPVIIDIEYLSLPVIRQRIRGFAFMRYINPRLTLTLTFVNELYCKPTRY